MQQKHTTHAANHHSNPRVLYILPLDICLLGIGPTSRTDDLVARSEAWPGRRLHTASDKPEIDDRDRVSGVACSLWCGGSAVPRNDFGRCARIQILLASTWSHAAVSPVTGLCCGRRCTAYVV
jgi:hypothetical protein